MNIDEQIENAKLVRREAKTIYLEADSEVKELEQQRAGEAFDNMFELSSFAFNPVKEVS